MYKFKLKMMVSELLDKFTNEILGRNPYGNPAW